jgi:DNA-binding NarL/FixJ family response regulator
MVYPLTNNRNWFHRHPGRLFSAGSWTQRVHCDYMLPGKHSRCRSREVLHLAAAGSTSAQIAERLFLSSRTVETHRANMMRKLGLRTQADLTRYAIERGILPPRQL